MYLNDVIYIYIMPSAKLNMKIVVTSERSERSFFLNLYGRKMVAGDQPIPASNVFIQTNIIKYRL